MKPEIINADSAVLQQLEGQWQKMLTLVVWKLANNGIHITSEDMTKFAVDPKNILLTHGHYDSFEFKMVTREDAERLADHDKTQHGHS